MWPFRRRNKVNVPDLNTPPKKPRIRDLWVQMKLVRAHIAGIHSMLSTINTMQLGHDANLQHVAARLDVIEQRVRPELPWHLAPDAQGRPPTDINHGLPADTPPAAEQEPEPPYVPPVVPPDPGES